MCDIIGSGKVALATLFFTDQIRPEAAFLPQVFFVGDAGQKLEARSLRWRRVKYRLNPFRGLGTGGQQQQGRHQCDMNHCLHAACTGK